VTLVSANIGLVSNEDIPVEVGENILHPEEVMIVETPV
jgi:hypothetical protein